LHAAVDALARRSMLAITVEAPEGRYPAVDSAAIVNAGNLRWGEFGSHRPEQMAMIALTTRAAA
jgi:hypothetical protein